MIVKKKKEKIQIKSLMSLQVGENEEEKEWDKNKKIANELKAKTKITTIIKIGDKNNTSGVNSWVGVDLYFKLININKKTIPSERTVHISIKLGK